MTSDPSAAEIYGRDFPAGAVVFEEGDPGSRMYVIQSGAVRILKRVAPREMLLQARLPPESPPGVGASPLDDYLALKRRFEPEETGRIPT